MVEGFGDKASGGHMVATLALVDIFENCLALLWLYAALVDTSNAAPDQLSLDYGVGCRSVLNLPSKDFVSWQLSVY